MLLNIEIDVLIPLYIKYPVLNLNIYLYVSSKLKVFTVRFFSGNFSREYYDYSLVSFLPSKRCDARGVCGTGDAGCFGIALSCIP